jgi:hypothetical protein
LWQFVPTWQMPHLTSPRSSHCPGSVRRGLHWLLSGHPEIGGGAAEAAGLVIFWPKMRFFHPLVRSAVYHAATAIERRQVHRALAAACDPELDAVPRAWHLASRGRRGPDEEVATVLEAAADRVGSRGGCAAAAALRERAALLTRDKERRAERYLLAAQAHVLAGTVDRAEALLVEATHGPHAASGTLLSALEAIVFAGWASSAALLEISQTAGELPPTGDRPARVPQLNGASGHADRHRRMSPTCAHPEAAQTPGHTFEPCSNQPPAEMQTRHVHGPSGQRSQLRSRRHDSQVADLRQEHRDAQSRMIDHGQTVSIPSGTPRPA